jgi:5-oxoprolinase (ATP-hydrolysing) subunit A
MPVTHHVIDLNADLGESYGEWTLGDDASLLPLITSANIACGFHAGDPLTLRRTVELAVEHRVVIGAQVSYPDLVGFGRRPMDVEPAALEADVLYQLSALDGISRVAGAGVRYVKPHGALYHRVLTDEQQATAVVAAVAAYSTDLAVVTMSGSVLAAVAATAGLRVVAEGFADRGYTAAGRLVPRGEPGAVLTDEKAVAAQALRLVDRSEVKTLCLHGDTPGAVSFARAVRTALAIADVTIRSFA